MESIIPEIAHLFGNSFKFQIIGDGGTKNLLEEKIITLGVSNVELLPPVDRKNLIKYYSNTDILFLHLNKLPAFKRVIPSKIFEYVAIGKPIVAGLSGYSASFVKENIEHAYLFDPGDVEECANCFLKSSSHVGDTKSVKHFVNKFSRGKIMDMLAKQIMSIAPN